MVRFSITVSNELDTWLKTEAKREDRSKSGQAAYILSLFFERNLTRDELNLTALNEYIDKRVDFLLTGYGLK